MLCGNQHIVAVDFGSNHLLSHGVSVGCGFAYVVQLAVLTASAPGFDAAFVASPSPWDQTGRISPPLAVLS